VSCSETSTHEAEDSENGFRTVIDQYNLVFIKVTRIRSITAFLCLQSELHSPSGHFSPVMRQWLSLCRRRQFRSLRPLGTRPRGFQGLLHFLNDCGAVRLIGAAVSKAFKSNSVTVFSQFLRFATCAYRLTSRPPNAFSRLHCTLVTSAIWRSVLGCFAYLTPGARQCALLLITYPLVSRLHAI
jgi:hypothetical protein